MQMAPCVIYMQCPLGVERYLVVQNPLAQATFFPAPPIGNWNREATHEVNVVGWREDVVDAQGWGNCAPVGCHGDEWTQARSGIPVYPLDKALAEEAGDGG